MEELHVLKDRYTAFNVRRRGYVGGTESDIFLSEALRDKPKELHILKDSHTALNVRLGERGSGREGE